MPYSEAEIVKIYEKLVEHPFKGCWEWKGTINAKGYGRVYAKERNRYVHRMMMEICLQEMLPEEIIVMHRCDNRICANPGHLQLGSITLNNIDRDQKGRTARGSKHGNSRLKEEEVILIKIALKYDHGVFALADRFCVSDSCIRNIKNNNTWRHVKVPNLITKEFDPFDFEANEFKIDSVKSHLRDLLGYDLFNPKESPKTS